MKVAKRNFIFNNRILQCRRTDSRSFKEMNWRIRRIVRLFYIRPGRWTKQQRRFPDTYHWVALKSAISWLKGRTISLLKVKTRFSSKKIAETGFRGVVVHLALVQCSVLHGNTCLRSETKGWRSHSNEKTRACLTKLVTIFLPISLKFRIQNENWSFRLIWPIDPGFYIGIWYGWMALTLETKPAAA